MRQRRPESARAHMFANATDTLPYRAFHSPYHLPITCSTVTPAVHRLLWRIVRYASQQLVTSAIRIELVT